MRKRLLAIFICAFFVVATAIPALACTPSYDYSNIWGDLTPPSQIEWKPSDELDKQLENGVNSYLKEHPIDLTKNTETETETESEIIETEETSVFDWSSYFPESFTNMMDWFHKEVNSKWNRLSTMSNQN